MAEGLSSSILLITRPLCPLCNCEWVLISAARRTAGCSLFYLKRPKSSLEKYMQPSVPELRKLETPCCECNVSHMLAPRC